MKLIRKISRNALALVLAATMVVVTIPMAGCTPQQVQEFEQVLSEVEPAAATILQIIALFKVGTDTQTIPAKIGADAAALDKLFNDYETASATAKGSILAEINAGFSTLQSDLSTVFALAQVSDKNTQAKLTALVGLIGSAIQIAENLVVAPTPAATAIAAPVLSAGSFVKSWNSILTAKTGDAQVDTFTANHGHLHVHSKFVRIISFGAAS